MVTAAKIVLVKSFVFFHLGRRYQSWEVPTVQATNIYWALVLIEGPWEFPGDPVIRTHYFHFWGAQVQFLIRELRFHKLHSTDRKRKKKRREKERDLNRFHLSSSKLHESTTLTRVPQIKWRSLKRAAWKSAEETKRPLVHLPPPTYTPQEGGRGRQRFP